MRRALAGLLALGLAAGVAGCIPTDPVGSVTQREPPVAATRKAPTSTVQPVATPWPMFGHDARHTGRSGYSGPRTGKVLWRYYTGLGPGDAAGPFPVYQTTSPVLGRDGTVYLTYGGTLHAVDRRGKKRWVFAPKGGGGFSTPAIGMDGTIYFADSRVGLRAMNPDGTEKWSLSAGGSDSLGPTVGGDGTIYLGCNDKRLYAVNPNGTKKWAFEALDRLNSTPGIAGDGTVYTQDFGGRLYAVNPDGTKKWVIDEGGPWSSAPAIADDGTIYVTGDASLRAINPDGSKKWELPLSGPQSSPAIDSDGTIYIGDRWGMHAVDPDGTEKWSVEVGSINFASPAVGADRIVYTGTTESRIGALGKRTIVIDATGCAPAIGDDGVLYVFTSVGGYLYAQGEAK